MWRLNDPTAMAAPSLYPSLQKGPTENLPAATVFFSEFTSLTLTLNPALSQLNFGLFTKAPGQRAPPKIMVFKYRVRRYGISFFIPSP